MRIIAGSAKGRNLKTPKDMMTRPTQDRVRESIFNVLMNYGLHGTAILDLFAGTGALGLEALSRGASSLVTVDRRTHRLIRTNAELCGFNEQVEVLPIAVQRSNTYLKGKKFDYIFVDPPYEKELVQLSVSLIEREKLLKDDGIVIIEHHKKETFLLPDSWQCIKEKDFDYTRVSYLSRNVLERS